MGRKKEFENRVSITGYLEQVEFDSLNEIRWREHKDLTEVIRSAVREYIKAHGSGNETFKLDNWQNNPDFIAVPTILADNEKWLSYLENCTPEERKQLLKQANIIRSFAINIGNFGVRKK